MVELTLVIITVGIISVVALPKFLNFAQEGRVASATQAVNALKGAVAMKKQQMMLKCGMEGTDWPNLTAINANDLRAGGQCTSDQINDQDAKFLTTTGLPDYLQNGNVSVVYCLCTDSLDPSCFPEGASYCFWEGDVRLDPSAARVLASMAQGGITGGGSTGGTNGGGGTTGGDGGGGTTGGSGSSSGDGGGSSSSSSSSSSCGSPYLPGNDTLCYDSCNQVVSDTYCGGGSSSSSSCPPGSVWDGTPADGFTPSYTCVSCPDGQTFDGEHCCDYGGYCRCGGSGAWNGTQCVSCNDGDQCVCSSGQTWRNGVGSPINPNAGGSGGSPTGVCLSIGDSCGGNSTWNGTQCVDVGRDGFCDTGPHGEPYTWNGNACVPYNDYHDPINCTWDRFGNGMGSGTWDSVNNTCDCASGLVWSGPGGSCLYPDPGCQSTGGSWDGTNGVCDCSGNGSGYAAWNGSNSCVYPDTVCSSTGGTYTLIDGSCSCPGGAPTMNPNFAEGHTGYWCSPVDSSSSSDSSGCTNSASTSTAWDGGRCYEYYYDSCGNQQGYDENGTCCISGGGGYIHVSTSAWNPDGACYSDTACTQLVGHEGDTQYQNRGDDGQGGCYCQQQTFSAGGCGWHDTGMNADPTLCGCSPNYGTCLSVNGGYYTRYNEGGCYTDSGCGQSVDECNCQSNCPVLGCTNSNAVNYNPSATQDDGSCQINGCTDPSATNYNMTANHDDGSCTY